MNITIVTTWFPTELSPSSGSFVARDSQAIHDAGGNLRIVHLVSSGVDDGTCHTTYKGIPVLRIPMMPSDPLSVLRASRHLAKAIDRSGIVHSQAMSSLMPMFLLKKMRQLHCPWIHTEHWSGLTNVGTLSRSLAVARQLILKFLKQPDVVVGAGCEYLASPIRQVRSGKETLVVPCIVEPQSRVIEPARSDPSINMVTVGGLIDRKDPLFCLDVLEVLIDKGRDVTMTFVGDGPLKPAIESRVASSQKLSGRVHLLGTLDKGGVTDALNASNIFIAPTHGDNFFIAVAEALVAGRPVVASDRGGQTEYVNDANGTIVPLGSTAQQWAGAVTDTLDRLSTSSAQAIADTIGDRFSQRNVGLAYMDIYRQMLENRVQ